MRTQSLLNFSKKPEPGDARLSGDMAAGVVGYWLFNEGTGSYVRNLVDPPDAGIIPSSFQTKPTTAARNDITGTFGFQFLPTCDIVITRIGRLYVAGNTHDHGAYVWLNGGAKMCGGTILNSSASDADGFKWVSVNPTFISPVNSTASYCVSSDETAGQDTFKDLWAPGTMNRGIYNIGSAWVGANNSTPVNLGANTNEYGTVCFEYRLARGHIPESLKTNWTTGANGPRLNLLGAGSPSGSGVPLNELALLSGATSWTINCIVNIPSGTASVAGGRPLYCERNYTGGNDILKLDTLNSTGGAPTNVGITLRDDAGTSVSVDAGVSIADGKDHMVTAVKSNNTLKIFVDGLLKNSATWTGTNTFTNLATGSALGYDPTAPVTFTTIAKVDQLFVARREFSAGEITRLLLDPYTMVRPTIHRPRAFSRGGSGRLLALRRKLMLA